MIKFGKTEFSKKPTYYYNLDVIISVGYRVKSKRGVIFRRWATSVLKQYMLKGYAVEPFRVLVTRENYLSLVNVVNRIDSTQAELISRVEKLESKFPELNNELVQFLKMFVPRVADLQKEECGINIEFVQKMHILLLMEKYT